VGRLPERIRRDLAAVAILGHDVDDGHTARPQRIEEGSRTLDDGPAALGRQRQRGDGRVEVTPVHVDGDHGRACWVETDHGRQT
jgi:hypothetical protein